MMDVLSILSEYVEQLPPSAEMKVVSQQSGPFYQRLCQLTGEQEADDIWFAALDVGGAKSSAAFRHGFPTLGGASGRSAHPLNRFIPLSIPSFRMHSMASAAFFTAASMAFLSSPANLPRTQSAMS